MYFYDILECNSSNAVMLMSHFRAGGVPPA